MALGPSPAPDRNLLGRLWWQLAATPLRLLGLGAGLTLLLGTTLLASAAATPDSVVILMLVAALAIQLIAAVAMEYLPRWTTRSPVHYLRYGGTFLFSTLGVVWIYLVALNGGGSWAPGGVVIAVAWLLVVATLRDYTPWLPRKLAAPGRLLTSALYLTGLALPTSLLL